MGQMRRPRHFATLCRLTETKSTGGVVVESWQDVETVPARFEPLRASEQQQDGREMSTVTARVHIRYRADVTPAMRIRVQGIMYDIESATDPEGRGRWLILEVSSIEGE